MIRPCTHLQTFLLYLVGEMSEQPACCAFDLRQNIWITIGISGAIHHEQNEVVMKLSLKSSS